MTDFATFERRKQALRTHYDRLIELIAQGEVVSEPAADQARLRDARDALTGDLLFRVLCVGDFSTGKSSFINRFLLEQDLLPAWNTPTTALPSRIRYGEQVRAIRFRAATPERMDLEEEIVTDKVAERLKDWVSTANKQSGNPDASTVIVEAPAPRLAAGVEIVDAPGLNDPNPERMKLTLDYLHQADGVLFFIDASKPWTKYQKEFFEGEILTQELLGRLFIIVNYWDLVPKAERGEVLDYVQHGIEASLASNQANLSGQSVPILPVCAKTGENAALIQEQVWDVLGARKSADVLALRIKRFNEEVAKYGQMLEDRLRLLELDPQGRSRHRARLQQEIADYEQQREAFLADLQRLLRVDFQAYCQSLHDLFQWIQTEVEGLDQPASGAVGSDFKTLLPLRMSRLQQQANQRLEGINEDFVQRIRDTIEAQKATIGLLPTKALTIEDYVLNWRGLGDNPLERAVPLAGGVGLAGLLVGAGTLWQTATIAPVATSGAVPGVLAQIGTFFMGSAAVPAAPAAASSFMLLGVPGIAIGVLGIAGAFLLNRIATDRSASAVRAWVLECGNQVLNEERELIKQIKEKQAQRIAQICADVNDDISRDWQGRLAELDAIQRNEDQGAALRALRDQIAALTLRVNL